MRPTPPRTRWRPLPVDGPKAPRSRRHPLDRMEHTEWMDHAPSRRSRTSTHWPPTVGRDLPPIGPSRWTPSRTGSETPGRPRLHAPFCTAPGSGGCRRGGSASRAPRLPCWAAVVGQRGCPCRCRAPASSDPGPLAPAAFPLDPGPGQGETAGAPSRGQGVEARPVKGVAEGPDDAVKLVKGGEETAAWGSPDGGCRRSPRVGGTRGFTAILPAARVATGHHPIASSTVRHRWAPPVHRIGWSPPSG